MEKDKAKGAKTDMSKESLRDLSLRLGFKECKPTPPKQEQSLMDYCVSLGMKEITRTGRGVVIGTGGPVEKKDDNAPFD